MRIGKMHTGTGLSSALATYTNTVPDIPSLQKIQNPIEGQSVNLVTSFGGMFIWYTGDFSLEVGIDPTNGIYIPSGNDITGSNGCWVRSDYDGVTVFSRWFGVNPQDGIDFISNVYNEPSSGTSGTPVVRGRYLLNHDATLTESLVLKPNIDYDFTGGNFKVIPTFTPTYNDAVVTQETTLYNSSFRGLKIQADNVDVRGFDITGIRVVFSDIYTMGCLKGNIVSGGYGVYGENVKAIGYNSSAVGAYLPDAYGFTNKATDSEYRNINCTFFNKGVLGSGNNTRWYAGHCWSLPATVPMKICWDVTNEGQKFFGCVSDTPTPDDTNLPPSLTNGGYGFLNRGNGELNQYHACEVISSEQAGNVDATVIPFKFDKEAEAYGCIWRNYATTSNIFILPAVQFISNTVKQRSKIVGGDILSEGSGNILLPGTAPNMTNTISLAVNGDSTGITYSNGTKYCAYSNVGIFTQFLIKFVLTSKGVGIGEVTIEGLPFNTTSGYGDDKGVPFKCYTSNPIIEGLELVIDPFPSTSAVLRYTATQLPLTSSDITDTTEFVITGQVLTADGFFDDVD